MPVDDTAIATAVRDFADSVAAPRHLAEQVIAAAHSRSTVPPPLRRRVRRMWLPITVGVAVALVAALVTVLASSVRREARPRPGGSHSAMPSPTPSSTNVVTIGGASLNLPSGWKAEPVPDSMFREWCLESLGQRLPANGDTNGCAATFLQVPSGSRGLQLSPDTTGGVASNPEWCGQVPTSQVRWTLLDYRNRDLGGRDAEYRRWTITCRSTATTWRIEQYVVDSAPAYILYSSRADARVHAALQSIAATSRLPRATGGLRYSDLGRVRAVTHDRNAYHLSLERVVDDQGSGKYVSVGGPYDYVAANGVLAHGAAPTVGSLVELTTDGHHVTNLNVLVGE